MQRWKLTIEYDGTPFVGWQMQKEDLSVQQVLEEAITAFSGEHARLHVAGRTDAGVHALGQVAHFDLEKEFDAKTVQDAINAHTLGHPVAILTAEAVSPEFHARFQAKKRYYMYRILCRRPRPVLRESKVWHIKHQLDLSAMQEASTVLLGQHDFTSFRASECQADSPVRTIDRLDVVNEADEIRIYVEAPSFLHHQVRNITGTLKLVGEGKWTKEDVKAALEARKRAAGGPTAPPCGLYFVKVDY